MSNDTIEQASNLWSKSKENEVIKLLTLLAENGNVQAKSNLGLMFCHYYVNENLIKLKKEKNCYLWVVRLEMPLHVLILAFYGLVIHYYLLRQKESRILLFKC